MQPLTAAVFTLWRSPTDPDHSQDTIISPIEPSYNGPVGTSALLLEKTAFNWSRFGSDQHFEEYQEPVSP